VDSATRIEEAGRLARVWAGLLLAPTAALLVVTAGYALVGPACAGGTLLPLHLVHLGGLLLALAAAGAAGLAWREAGPGWPGDEPGRSGALRFLAATGALVSLLFALVMVALWLPVFVLSPCQ